MLLDFSVDWQWVIGGTDVSPFVETWELAREQPDVGTPAWWRGKLVLRPVVGRNLNLDPLTNSLWRQGTACSLTVAGSLVFTGSLLLAYYDDWSTAPRLELEVGDVLAAKNHRQVIPFGEYDAWSLLVTLGIPGVAPAGNKVELSTDLTSPMKVLQELTWVAGLRAGRPATLFTRPNGLVTYASPQAEISLTRTLEQVADFTRQRPALEIPGSVIASASLTYLVQPATESESERLPIEWPASGGPLPRGSRAIVSKEGEITKITYVDLLGRLVREETYRSGVFEGRSDYSYFTNSRGYEITKTVWVKGENGLYRFEYIKEIAKRVEGRRISTGNARLVPDRGSTPIVSGQVTARKKVSIFWPANRLFPVRNYNLILAYLIEEYSFRTIDNQAYLLRLTSRARGTTQDTDTFEEAVTLSPTVSDIIPNQEIRFPAWAQPKETEQPEQPERITDILTEEVTVPGLTGPPAYLAIPWLSVTVEEPVDPRDRGQRIGSLRQMIRFVLRTAATWMAVEIAGRAFARRIKMPVPPEWLGDPRPWTLARVGNEVFWLVGETLRGTAQGVEFEATGILAGRPSTIPPGEFPPGMIPAFIPLITVAPTRFPQVGIGCAMSAGEMVAIPGDPWLGMAVEIEYEVSAPVGTFAMVGIGVGELAEAWLGLAVDATYEVEGGEDNGDDEDDSGGEVEGLTLEAEDGTLQGAFAVYDVDASSCYAVGTGGGGAYTVDFSVSSEDISWDRPLRLRVVYKATDDGEIYVFVLQGGNYLYVGHFEASATTGYVTADLIIPVSLEPFNGISVDVFEISGEIRLDAIQLAPATGDWPPLNPCSD